MTDAKPIRWYLRPFSSPIIALLVVFATIAGAVGVYAWKRTSAIASARESRWYVAFKKPPKWLPKTAAEHWPEWARRVEFVHAELEAKSKDFDRLSAFREVDSLDLSGPAVSDSDLEQLAGFPRLRGLSLSSSKVTDAGLAWLAKCPRLERLRLAKTSITDAGLAHLARLQIQSLDLSGTRVTDAGMETLARFAMLSTLDLDQTAVGDAGVEKLKGLPLVKLSLTRTKVTDAGLAAMGPMAVLQSFSLKQTVVGDGGLAALGSWLRLEELELSETKITDAGLEHLSKLPLSILNLSQTAITTAGLEKLPFRTRWISIDVCGNEISSSAVEGFAKAHNLVVEGPTQSMIVIPPGTRGSITEDYERRSNMNTSGVISNSLER